jgi:hypothetical protein
MTAWPSSVSASLEGDRERLGDRDAALGREADRNPELHAAFAAEPATRLPFFGA